MDQRLQDKLSSDIVTRGLTTRWLGKGLVHYFDVVGSTNVEARRFAHEGAPEGTLIVADAQTKGRGRLERSWVSPAKGGLYLSLILRPDRTADWLPKLTLAAGVSVANAILRTGLTPQLKWPNDVLIAGQKTAGILSEAEFSERQIAFAILGIGINVNIKKDEFPVSIRNTATSLRLSLGQPVSRVGLLQTLLVELEQCYESLQTGGFANVLQTWSEFDTTLGREVEVFLPAGRVKGMAEALDTDGTLLVRDSADRLHKILAGDVVYCRLESPM